MNVNTKKHKHHGSKHHKEQKHHTNSNPCGTNNKERHSNRNFDDWYCQDRIAYHSERDKFDNGYYYRDQDNYDRAPKAIRMIGITGIGMLQIGIMTEIGTEMDIVKGIIMIEGNTLLITLMMKR